MNQHGETARMQGCGDGRTEAAGGARYNRDSLPLLVRHCPILR
jgi:hypothetical protein